MNEPVPTITGLRSIVEQDMRDLRARAHLAAQACAEKKREAGQ